MCSLCKNITGLCRRTTGEYFWVTIIPTLNIHSCIQAHVYTCREKTLNQLVQEKGTFIDLNENNSVSLCSPWEHFSGCVYVCVLATELVSSSSRSGSHCVHIRCSFSHTFPQPVYAYRRNVQRYHLIANVHTVEVVVGDGSTIKSDLPAYGKTGWLSADGKCLKLQEPLLTFGNQVPWISNKLLYHYFNPSALMLFHECGEVLLLYEVW